MWSVDEPFRARKAARRGLNRAIPLSRVPLREMTSLGEKSTDSSHQSQSLSKERQDDWITGDDDEEALIWAAQQEEDRLAREKRKEMEKMKNLVEELPQL
ncbi:a01a1083-adbf-4f20-8cf3-23b5e23c82d2 [Sclerotinia trifoliorum]|uniref:A01a1083-adbf-4f20-8cf3-23b5e23c82d2 n=1 Tax=Sclerotinia trifoliorum TaxID=28548 RepID=A0A8H2VL37_9HELO|nr:a01a1083-adbf-4f20-8cf3-23b5e23c82d2 [Sclerotinia trifoliorum]